MNPVHSRCADQSLPTVRYGPLAEAGPALLLVGRGVDVLLVDHVVGVVVRDVGIVGGELGLRRRPPPLHWLDHHRLARQSHYWLRRYEHGRCGGHPGGPGSSRKDWLPALGHGGGWEDDLDRDS